MLSSTICLQLFSDIIFIYADAIATHKELWLQPCKSN